MLAVLDKYKTAAELRKDYKSGKELLLKHGVEYQTTSVRYLRQELQRRLGQKTAEVFPRWHRFSHSAASAAAGVKQYEDLDDGDDDDDYQDGGAVEFVLPEGGGLKVSITGADRAQILLFTETAKELFAKKHDIEKSQAAWKKQAETEPQTVAKLQAEEQKRKQLEQKVKTLEASVQEATKKNQEQAKQIMGMEMAIRALRSVGNILRLPPVPASSSSCSSASSSSSMAPPPVSLHNK